MWNKYDFKELGEGLQGNALPNCQVPGVLPKEVHLRGFC